MVKNFNEETRKNVNFILFENQHNKDINTKYKVSSDKELLKILK